MDITATWEIFRCQLFFRFNVILWYHIFRLIYIWFYDLMILHLIAYYLSLVQNYLLVLPTRSVNFITICSTFWSSSLSIFTTNIFIPASSTLNIVFFLRPFEINSLNFVIKTHLQNLHDAVLLYTTYWGITTFIIWNCVLLEWN